ncbi:MAG: hypothetical protein MMC33_005959 [Icmadophila ericetorum]|nr:hypothetical protein [Icmadophila ericetorum]
MALPYDPKQLLNPRNRDLPKRRKDEPTGINSSLLTKASENANPQFIFDTPRNEANSEVENGSIGMSRFIERSYNLSNREYRPRKKARKDYDSDGTDVSKPKAVFTGGGKGGDLGEYMKQKRKEGQDALVGTSAVVDLTADDDDVQIVSVSDNGDQEVCYGRLDLTKVQAHIIPTPDPKATYLSKTDWPSMRLRLERLPAKNSIIRVYDPSGRDFGTVDTRTSLGLASLMDSTNPRIRTQARLTTRKREPDQIPGQQCSAYFDMTINLYGPRRHAASIGKYLSQKQLFLRNPYGVEKGIDVCNPHAYQNPSTPRTVMSGTSNGGGATNGYAIRTVEEIRNDVLGMFDTLEKSENLPEMEPDSRIKTPLLSHQKQGLYFMFKKEKARVYGDREEDKNSLWIIQTARNGQQLYVNVITGKEERRKPPEVLGGILADMMGLGKTLSILSLIVGSLDEAQEWAKQKPPPPGVSNEHTPIRNVKTTLLVSPLSTIANWEEQISTHIKPSTLSYYIYHGHNRCQNIDELAKFDMVVTTYSIVSSEFNGRSKKRNGSPLLQTNFFRIVLDEAHMIREQATRQSQAICTLSAQRRWAVTGTPVQNRLDDLAALIKFLRVKPFDEKGGFTQFISTPFKNADPEILPKLRLLVDSITLRRLKDRIDLPPRKDLELKLDFNEEERQLYDWFAKDSQAKVNILAGEEKKGLGGKTYVHILQAILRLRLICAHGKELLGEEDLKLTKGLTFNSAIDVDDDDTDQPAMGPRQAYDMFMLLQQTGADNCTRCARRIGPKENEEMLDEKNEIFGHMLPCYQCLCTYCYKDFKQMLEQHFADENHFVCPFCEQYLRKQDFALRQNDLEEAEDAKASASENPRQAKKLGQYGGPHTKTIALIHCLRSNNQESRQKPHEPPIKSVVFSGWTAHLDLLQIALEANEIKYVRLDGKMTRSARTASLETFRDDPRVTVILVSITAGGLGLNLTTASRVYVMEPQFNPAAEAQAVDRVHRLGQKREVINTRFIMRNSFEEQMLKLQRKKQNLADLSMNRGKVDKAEAAREKLAELRSLFK